MISRLLDLLPLWGRFFLTFVACTLAAAVLFPIHLALALAFAVIAAVCLTVAVARGLYQAITD